MGVRPYEPESVMNNWPVEELPVVFKTNTEYPDVNVMSNPAMNLELSFEQDMCLQGSQVFEDDEDSETIEIVTLEVEKEVKIGTCIKEETKQNLIKLLQEFKDIFAWSYQDMPGLSTDIAVHRIPIREECKPVQQKLRRMRPDMAVKIREGVKKEFDAGFLQAVNYSEWVANVVPIPKKDGKIKMHPEDMEKTTFITLWGTFFYKVVSSGLKNAGAAYKRAMTRLRKFQLKLNPTKCTFGARSGKLLGFVVSEKGIEVDPDKVKAIQELPPPRTQREKVVKGRAIADFLASGALENYEPLKFDSPNDDLMYVATTEEDTPEDHSWKLNFDGVSNSVGNRVGAVLISPNRDHYTFTCKLDFDCTNNMTEYEAGIMGIRAAIDRKIKVLEVYGDSALVIYQLKGAWETRDPKLISYRKLVLELIEQFDNINFFYLPRDENQMADALATLASVIRINEQEDMRPIQMSICESSAHCCNIDEEEERDDHPWYHNILKYVKNREYPEQATENDKRTLRRLANDYVLDGEILYKKRKDQVLLRCVDTIEAKKILEEVHEGVCGTHANGFTIARQIMRFGYYWSTMEGDCIRYDKKCHKCQIYGDKIHVPHSPLYVMTSPWPFSM
ncbi:hypothetical protein CXB51_004048 [Gossypium anomalum]|uniref:RNase H type-1 domain-containing protein n=1 Tax=Gossypium anomalum TaxID=47600 RepID=A0A8J5ZGX7_9ROSI|nr:hypothetical protein CXB51_004048 [Gossypium anomalum]